MDQHTHKYMYFKINLFLYFVLFQILQKFIMAAMVKTYILLCVVGLCTTLFVILIMYGDDHQHIDLQSQIRRIKPPDITLFGK